jgi:hypothetical protein
MSPKSTTLIGAGVLALVLGLGHTAATATDVSTPNSPDVSGAVRCSAGKWSTVEDSAHASTGIESITDAGKYLIVTHSPLKPIGSLQASVDETYLNNGVDVGASVGTTSTKLYFTKFGKKVDPKYLCIDWSNIWISGWSK